MRNEVRKLAHIEQSNVHHGLEVAIISRSYNDERIQVVWAGRMLWVWKEEAEAFLENLRGCREPD